MKEKDNFANIKDQSEDMLDLTMKAMEAEEKDLGLWDYHPEIANNHNLTNINTPIHPKILREIYKIDQDSQKHNSNLEKIQKITNALFNRRFYYPNQKPVKIKFKKQPNDVLLKRNPENIQKIIDHLSLFN